VDLERGRIAIVQTRVAVEYAALTSQPKTNGSRRSVPLDAELVAAFRAHRTHQLEERMALGQGWEDSGHVFVREDGKPYHPERLTQMFERNARRAGLRSIRFHDLRHTMATLALQAGIPVKVVSEWLGHSSTTITSDLYQHVTPSMDEQAGARVTGLLLSRPV
jgi:integrase